MIIKNWIIDKLKENDLDKSKVVKLYDLFIKETGSNANVETYSRKVREYYELINETIDLNDYDDESVLRLEASKQRLQDINNHIKKSNREGYRIYNTLEEIYLEYINALKDIDFTKFKIKSHKFDICKHGILQLSDLHFNELIYANEANGNSYDFIIASKRLKKYITEAIALFKYKKITDVHVILTGDNINSSRRLGEKLAQATSLVRASLLATYLLSQVIIELSQYFNIEVSGVSGNESRISEEWGSSDIELSENFDYLIFEQLKLLFEKTNVRFNESKNKSQALVKIGNFNYLILHGNQLRTANNPEKDINKILQQYIYNGIRINGIFYGHYHSSAVGDVVSRSSSLCGGNAYSTNDLNFLSRPSQNIYFINKDGSYDAMKIDLLDISGYDGYTIIDKLERYQVKSIGGNSIVTIENLT